MAEKEQIRITLKPKGAKIKISLPEEPAEKQQEVMPPSPRDVPKEPAEKIRISLRHAPAPAEPPPVAKIVREEPPPMPRQEKKTEEQLREAAKSAVCKINIDSDSRLAMTAGVRKVFAEKPAEFDPRKYLGPARDRMKAMYTHKVINVLGSAGHAYDK